MDGADTGHATSRHMRALLMACGAMNVVGTICFLPPFLVARRMVRLPDAPPFYLWVLAAWILAFGAAYAHQGWTGRLNRSVLALGAWGKATFAVALVSTAIGRAAAPVAIVAAMPDAACAAAFGWWLWRSSREKPG